MDCDPMKPIMPPQNKYQFWPYPRASSADPADTESAPQIRDSNTILSMLVSFLSYTTLMTDMTTAMIAPPTAGCACSTNLCMLSRGITQFALTSRAKDHQPHLVGR